MNNPFVYNRLKSVFVFAFLIFCCCFSGFGQSNNASYGKALLQKMSSFLITPGTTFDKISMQGQLNLISQNQTMEISQTIDFPDAILTTIEMSMGKVVMSYKNGTGKMVMGGQERSLPKDQAKNLKRGLNSHYLAIARNSNQLSAKYLGTEQFNDKEYAKIRIPIDGVDLTFLVDPITGHPAVLRQTTSINGQKNNSEQRYSNWNRAAGVAIAYEIENYNNGKKYSATTLQSHQVDNSSPQITSVDLSEPTPGGGLYTMDFISALVKQKVEKWQQKGEFETTEAYQQRVTEETRNQKVAEFQQGVVDSLGSSQYDFEIAKTNYDADNGTFQLQMANDKELFVEVPLSEAKVFDQNARRIQFTDRSFSLTDNGKIVLRNATLRNPANSKGYQYTADSDISFNTSELALNFDPIDVNIRTENTRQNVKKTNNRIELGKADVDVNIPETGMQNNDAIAVVIGNSKYSGDTPDVKFAVNDAQIIKKYLVKTMGFRPGNILYEENATKTRIEVLLGDERTPGKLKNYVKPGKSDVFVFYSGHGAPDPNTKTGYIIPVDGDPTALSISGYSLEVLYNNLANINAKSTQVVIDACFSGATGHGEMLVQNASPIGIQVTNPSAKLNNGLVISASSGSQVASWYPEKGHGLLTYFYLKGLQGAADLNEDNKVVASELKTYLSDRTDSVPYYARRLHGREQTPQVFAKDPNKIIVEY